MSVLANLLRLHRRECEDRRRYAVELEHLAKRLRAVEKHVGLSSAERDNSED